MYVEETKKEKYEENKKNKKFMRNWKEEFVKNIKLHIGNQQDKQRNNYSSNKNKNIIHTNEIIISYISQ